MVKYKSVNAFKNGKNVFRKFGLRWDQTISLSTKFEPISKVYGSRNNHPRRFAQISLQQQPNHTQGHGYKVRK